MKNLYVVGPTACGKSSLAIDIAKSFDCEIVSCDSMQIYKKMNIGTAKITEDETKGIRHYMIDIIEPFESFSVAEYSKKAREIIKAINCRNKSAIICGGTGLYVDALLYPLSFGKSEKNENIRNKLEQEGREYGYEKLYQKLYEIDKNSAEKINKNDFKRVIRALEIYYVSGKTKSHNEIISKEIGTDNIMIRCNMERSILYERINDRVDAMFFSGLVEEIKNLLKDGLNFDKQSMQAIGYKEFKDYFNGECNLEDVKEKIKLDTRHYAKRQITWFKKYKNAIDFDCLTDDFKALKNTIEKRLIEK